MTEPRNYYATPELAAAYDADCAGRTDLDFYLGLAAELGEHLMDGYSTRRFVAGRRNLGGRQPNAQDS